MLFNMAGGGSGTTFDLLWENANPNSSFAAQTISLDTEGYNMFVILTSSGTFLATFYDFLSSVTHYAEYQSYSYVLSRLVQFSKGSVTFGDCKSCRLATSNSNLMEVQNTGLVPYGILGVKGVPAWE